MLRSLFRSVLIYEIKLTKLKECAMFLSEETGMIYPFFVISMKHKLWNV